MFYGLYNTPTCYLRLQFITSGTEKQSYYCIPTKQISYYANVILVLQTLSLLPFFGEGDRKFLKNNKFFKPVFQKNVVKKRIRIDFSPTYPFSSAIVNKLLFANWFATQFYHKPNNISSGICLFFEKYKNKSRINRCGLILLDKLIYLFLKTASFIILANSS